MTKKCQRCGFTDERFLLHHHISYEPEEVVTLCWACHKEVHGGKEGRKSSREVSTRSRLQKLRRIRGNLARAIFELRYLEDSFLREQESFQRMFEQNLSAYWSKMMERASEIADTLNQIRGKTSDSLELIERVTDFIQSYRVPMPHESNNALKVKIH